jgi:hypothetical protein
MEVIAWATAGEIMRLHALGSHNGRPAKGRIGGYEILETRPLSKAQLADIGTLLLDPDVYHSVDIRRPIRPDGIGRGAGKLCGGFRPAIGLRLRDDEGRSADVFICFTCDEVEFSDVVGDSKRADSLARPPAPLGEMPRGSRRMGFSKRGSLQTLRIVLATFSQDEELLFQLDKRVKP